MGVILRNNVFSVLSAPLGTSDASMVVSPADGDLFPSPGPEEYFYATISSPGAPMANNNPTVLIEIVKVTGRSGNALAIERGHDDTVPLAFPAGAVVALRINAASVMDSFITNYDVLLL